MTIHSLLVTLLLLVLAYLSSFGTNKDRRGSKQAIQGITGDGLIKLWRRMDFRTRKRIVIGKGGRVKIGALNSLVVFGPTRCGKTSSVLIPMLCNFDGSAVVTSVKNDVFTNSHAARSLRSKTLVISEYEGDRGWRWDPADYAKDLPAAREVAHHMVISSNEYRNSSGDAKFWYRLAEPLLTGVLLASCTADSLDERKVLCNFEDLDFLLNRLDSIGEQDLTQSILGVLRNDERHASSVLITAQSVLSPHLQALELLHDASFDLDLHDVLHNRSTDPFTIYLIASLSSQERLAPYFGTIISLIGATLLREEHVRCGVLFALDELANVAPVSDLAKFASVGMSFGLQMVSVFQDFAQIRNVCGDSAGTVVNNHGTKIFFGGITDPSTLELFRSIRPLEEKTGVRNWPDVSELRFGEALVLEPFRAPSKIRLLRRSSTKEGKKFTFG